MFLNTRSRPKSSFLLRLVNVHDVAAEPSGCQRASCHAIRAADDHEDVGLEAHLSYPC